MQCKNGFRTDMMRAAMALLAWLALMVFGVAQAQQAKPALVRLADQPAAEVDYAAVWVAEMLGYYDQEGIKIDRRTYPNGPAALLDFPSGAIDAVALTGPADFPNHDFFVRIRSAQIVVAVEDIIERIFDRQAFPVREQVDGDKFDLLREFRVAQPDVPGLCS